MAEAGSFADRVKQQADIVRVIGEYVRLKKSGQNFTGLCPFHSEKTPSFAVHPVKQIYHCFGCGAGGDVFKFVMEMDKCDFMESVRTVAEKCGIAIPRGARTFARRAPRTAATHGRSWKCIAKQPRFSRVIWAARQRAKRRWDIWPIAGSMPEAIAQFGVGYAPSAGDALARHLKAKYPDKLLEISGLVSRDPGGRLYDRFRRRDYLPDCE